MTKAVLGLAILLSAGWPLPASWSGSLADRLDPPTALAQPAIPRDELPTIQGEPPLGAPSAALFDRESRTILWSRRAMAERPTASLAKLMTAMVVLDHTDPSRLLTATPADLSVDPAESSMGLHAGSTLSVGELLHGLLISSGNDAATVLARGVAGNQSIFVTWMNEKASALSLIHTHFANPTGLDDPTGHSSASDLVIIADYALRYPEIADITRLAHFTARDQSGHTYPLTSTNQLNLSGETIGVKTGSTPGAGECLIALERLGGHEILSVVLASPDRFGETQALMNWTKEHVRWQLSPSSP